jgi:hypothetical protein
MILKIEIEMTHLADASVRLQRIANQLEHGFVKGYGWELADEEEENDKKPNE